MSAAAARLVEADRETMRHALVLAQRGLGNTWPNPAVGAVVWRLSASGPVVLGRGWTQPGGRPHAETVALAAAGEAARGATISVTLEPCSHHGKTPPCSDAIVAAGIARVVSAIEDPDPRVNGRGHIGLRARGIEVTVGVLAREARLANLGFIRKVVDKRPLVTVKIARTADGFAARHAGPRLMITGEATQARVHWMRAQHDVIVTGVETVLADDPQLTCRLPGLEDRSPVRVVLDSRLRTPSGCRLLADIALVPVWIVTTPDAPDEAEAVLTAAGATVIRVAATRDGRVNLRAALAALAGRGVTRAMVEAGPMLAEALAAADLVDEVAVFTGPAPLAHDGVPALGPVLSGVMAGDPRFLPQSPRMIGADRLDRALRRL